MIDTGIAMELHPRIMADGTGVSSNSFPVQHVSLLFQGDALYNKQQTANRNISW